MKWWNNLDISGTFSSDGATVPLSGVAATQDYHLLRQGEANTAYAASGHAHVLNDLTDVSVGSAASGQQLNYDGTSWVPETKGAAGSYAEQADYLATSGYVDTLVSFSGIQINASGGSINQGMTRLEFESASIVSLGGGAYQVSGLGVGGGGGATELANLSDVGTLTPSSGHHFVHNGTQWVNAAPIVYETSGTVEAHTSEFNHSSFITQATADGLYEVSGTVDAHKADSSDVHAQYLLKTDAASQYAASGTYADISHNHDGTYEVSGTVEAHTGEFNHAAFALSGQSYYKAESDLLYQPAGSYALSGQSYYKAEADSRFAASGLYETSGTSYTKTESDARFAPTAHNHDGVYEVSGTVAAHVADTANIHPQYLTTVDASGIYQPSGTYADAGHAHDTAYEVSGTVEAHTTEFNHSTFLTQSTADGLYEVSGTVVAHEANSGDIHTQYLLKTDAASQYAASGTYADIGHTHSEYASLAAYAATSGYVDTLVSFSGLRINVSGSTPTYYQALRLEFESGSIVPLGGGAYQLSGLGAGGGGGATQLSALSDVSWDGSPASGQHLIYDGSFWRNYPATVYETSGTVDTHKADSSDVHAQYLLKNDAPSLYAASGTYADVSHSHDGTYEVSGTVEAHTTEFDHSTFLDQATADGLYAASGTYADVAHNHDGTYEVSGTVEQHTTDWDHGTFSIDGHVHPQYLTTVDASGVYQPLGNYEVSGTVEAHTSEFNHATFITQATADGLYEVSGTVDTHKADSSDVHTQYLLKADAPALYAASGHTHPLNDLTDVSVGSAASGQQLNYDGTNWIPETKGAAGSYATQADYLATSGYVDTLVSFSGIQVNISGGAITEGVKRIQFIDGSLTNLGGGAVEISGSGGSGGGASTLTQLTDVTIATPVSGQQLRYNGGQWVNEPDPLIFDAANLPTASADYRGKLVIATSGGRDYIMTSLSGVAGYSWKTFAFGD